MNETTIRLEANNLSVRRGKKEILQGISFSIRAGEVYGLLGGNGAGKSTTLLTFLGFLTPAGGEARVNGKRVNQDPAAVRRAIAYLPESAALYEHLNAYDNLTYFLGLAQRTVSNTELEAALDQVSLPAAARGNLLKDYSKGMRQKVAIALAILRDTEILLLDEPTSGLDPRAIDEFHGLIRGLADAGKSIVMVTHDVYGACQIADRIGLLRDGRLSGEFAATGGTRIATEAVHRAFAEQ